MRYTWLLLALFWIGGCAPRLPSDISAKERRLYSMIVQMDSSVSHHEASRLAHEAIIYSQTLARKYKVQTSPWVHNFLVNAGLKKRGLCYQWADDLMSHLSTINPKTLRLLPIGANIGDYWREHNAVAVLPSKANIPLSRGIILDAWRYSGDLYFAPVGSDTKYRWKIRTERITH